MDDLLALALMLAGLPVLIGLANLILVTVPQGRVPDRALVSILVRARNAEADIGACIAHALGQIGVAVEVIVLDDGSLDHTGELLAALARREGRFRILAGSAPPRGWTRRAHAQAALATAAQGTHFLFIDASVRLDPHAAAALAGQAARIQAGMVSGAPRLHLTSLGAALAEPLRGLLSSAVLPGGGRAASRLPVLASACGTLVLVSRTAYGRAGGHASVRGETQDMPALARVMRRQGIRTDMVDAGNLACRRAGYGPRQAWARMARMPRAPAFLLAVAHGLPFCLLPAPPAVLALLLLAGLRIGVAARLREPWWAVPLHPAAMLMLAAAQGKAVACAPASQMRPWVRAPDPVAGRTPP